MSHELNEQDRNLLDDYLARMEDALANVSPADRSDIVLEINSHITESLGTGSQALDDILKALGDPVEVANRYLIARGIQPFTARKRPIFRWLLIGGATVFLLTIITGILFVKSFFPFIEVDEKAGKVNILGGAIKIDADEEGGAFSFNWEDGDGQFHFKSARSVTGSISSTKFKKLYLRAMNGKFSFKVGKGNQVKYDCKLGQQGAPSSFPDSLKTSVGDTLNFDLGRYTSGKCELTIPKKLALQVRIMNGKVDITNPQQNIDVELKHGKIRFQADSKTKYSIDAQARMGKVKWVENVKTHPKGPGVHSVKLSVRAGKIEII